MHLTQSAHESDGVAVNGIKLPSIKHRIKKMGNHMRHREQVQYISTFFWFNSRREASELGI